MRGTVAKIIRRRAKLESLPPKPNYRYLNNSHYTITVGHDLEGKPITQTRTMRGTVVMDDCQRRFEKQLKRGYIRGV